MPLEKVIKIRNQYIEDFEERIKLKKMDFNSTQVKTTKIESIEENKVIKKKKTKYKEKKVDTYIYQLAPSKYQIRIKKGTKGELGYFYFCETIIGSLADARKLRDTKLAEYKLNKNVSSNKGNITLEEFSKIFLENHCAGLSSTTVDGVISKLDTDILPKLGKYKLSKLDPLILKRFINELMNRKKLTGKTEEKISSTTANDVYRLLRNMLNRAVDWEYLNTNPLLKVQAPPIAKTEKDTFNKEQMIEVFDFLKSEDVESKCMFVITLFTGFRKGELLGLHLEDINYEASTLHVARDVVRDKQKHNVVENAKPKTEKSIRDVPVPFFCLEIIDEYLEWRNRKIEGLKLKDSHYKEIDNLFLSEKGDLMRPEYPGKKWNEFLDKYDLKHVTLHGLRHSYCTLQMNENPELGPNDVAALMGHSQLSTTFKYSHKNKNKKKEAVSIFKDFSEGKTFNINQILSICTGRKYASTKAIGNILNYLLPNENIDVLDKMKYCKEEVLKKYPKMKNLDDRGVSVDNVFDWIEQQQEMYGDQFTLTPVNVVQLEVEKQEFVYNKNSSKVL